MLNCAGICLCLIFFWLNSLANWKEFRGINSWLLKVSMQWRGNVSFCDRLGDLKEEQLKRSTSLTWVHCKKGDSVFGRLFGLLLKSLPVWCLLVLRVVLLLGGGGGLFLLVSISRFAWKTRLPCDVRDLTGHCVVFLGITLKLQYPSPSLSLLRWIYFLHEWFILALSRRSNDFRAFCQNTGDHHSEEKSYEPSAAKNCHGEPRCRFVQICFDARWLWQ